MLTTAVSQAYNLTSTVFDINGPITTTFDGVLVVFTSTPNTSGYDTATATGLVALATSTALDFSTVGGVTALEDVSVTVSMPVPVPEPISLDLLRTGLLGLGLTSRRCKAA